MHFLDACGARTGHDERQIDGRGQCAAVAAQQADGGDVVAARVVDSREHVRGVTRGAERQQQVAGSGKRLQLAREDLFEAVVVADGGERRGVGGQGHAGQALALGLEAAGEFGGEVLGVGGRSAIATGEHASAPAQGLGQPVRRAHDVGRHLTHSVEGGLMLVEAGVDPGGHRVSARAIRGCGVPV